MPESWRARVSFDETLRVMEIDLSHRELVDSADVAALYDHLEARAAEAGGKWFFLINYAGCVILPAAWVAFAHRGKRFNEAVSLGSLRYAAREDTGDEIARRAESEDFDANLLPSRAAALAKLEELHAAWAAKQPRLVAEEAPHEDYGALISFDHDHAAMDVDFSDFEFTDSRLVNQVYDAIERRIAESGRRQWYFLVNYRNCSVSPAAWVAFAHRGKRLNIAHSLGSFRYAAADATAEEIARRAEREDFDANLLPSRAAALAKVAELQSGESRAS